MDTAIRLTQMTAASGCAAKLGPGTLSDILKGLPNGSDPNLLVGFDTNDDACVYRITDKIAAIHTVDFFTPIVDDPFWFGQIAAANALSDVYAMGGRPAVAMNLLCVPCSLPQEVIRRILEGGHQKAVEAGCVIAGGHTIQDHEPKYGLCVTGYVHPDRVLRNVGAQPGDALILTKPIGTGVLTAAAKGDLVTPEQYERLLHSMATLNAAAAERITACPHILHGRHRLRPSGSQRRNGTGQRRDSPAVQQENPTAAGGAETGGKRHTARRSLSEHGVCPAPAVRRGYGAAGAGGPDCGPADLRRAVGRSADGGGGGAGPGSARLLPGERRDRHGAAKAGLFCRDRLKNSASRMTVGRCFFLCITKRHGILGLQYDK